MLGILGRSHRRSWTLPSSMGDTTSYSNYFKLGHLMWHFKPLLLVRTILNSCRTPFLTQQANIVFLWGDLRTTSPLLKDRLWQQDESIIVGCVATMSCDAGSCGVEEEWRAGAENPRHDTNGPTEDKWKFKFKCLTLLPPTVQQFICHCHCRCITV